MHSPEIDLLEPDNQRVMAIFNVSKLDQRGFAAKIGITPQGFNKIVKGEVSPSAKVLSSIAKSYPAINARWLLTGEGEMWQGGTVSVGAGAQVAIASKNVQQHQYDPCAELRAQVTFLESETKHLQQRIADKDALIDVLKQQK